MTKTLKGAHTAQEKEETVMHFSVGLRLQVDRERDVSGTAETKPENPLSWQSKNISFPPLSSAFVIDALLFSLC